MKFTLSLRDYIDQYITNLENGDNHCPVCYEQVMNDDDKDISIEVIKDPEIVIQNVDLDKPDLLKPENDNLIGDLSIDLETGIENNKETQFI